MCRFSYIQHLELTSMKQMTPEQKTKFKNDVSRCMLTSPQEWDYYAGRRDMTNELGDVCAELRAMHQLLE
jgi:hypothetical protein